MPGSTNKRKHGSNSSPPSGSKASKKKNAGQKTPSKVVIPPAFDLEMGNERDDELAKLIKTQMALMETVKDKVDTTNEKLDRIDTESKALIATNTYAIRGLEEAFKIKATSDDVRFNAMEEKVNKITDLIQNGNTLTLDPASKIEAAHEKLLQAMIGESKFCVTVLGHGEEELTLQKLAIKLADHDYHLDGKSSLKLVALQRLGNSTTQAPYKLTLDSPTTANSLVEQSKLKSRASEGRASHIRFVRHFPQAYANASRDFRQMAALLYDSGVHASVEYEGTTLTLKGKSMQQGGEWVIVPGGEFRPLVVGRQVAPEGEDPALSTARTLLSSALDNRKSSPLALSLNLHTERILGELKDVVAYLGPTISQGLTAVRPNEGRKGSSVKYSLEYDTRDHAKKALEVSKNKEAITNLNKDKGFLSLLLPVVAP